MPEIEEKRGHKHISRRFEAEIKGNCILIGPYGCGKTTSVKKILSEEKNRVPVYVDLSKLSISPESFATELISEACFYLTHDKRFRDFSFVFSNKKFNKSANDIIDRVYNELLKIKPDQRLLVNLAFEFLEKAGNLLVVFDEFQEILGLNNYDQIKDIISIFNNFDLSNTQFLLTSSSVQLMDKIELKNIKKINIETFSLDETKELIKSITKTINEQEINEIHSLTNGYPFFIFQLLKFKNKKINDAFLELISDEENVVYQSLKYEFFHQLRGQTLLKVILKIIAHNDPLRLNEISSKIYRSSPVTKSLLQRLIDSDLIVKIENRYDYANPVLKKWAFAYFGGEL